MNGAIYPSLKDRAVFITGGATGIGAALVRAFAGQGARVGFVDIEKEAGAALARETQSHFDWCDVTDTIALRAAMQKLSNAVGSFRVLVNNAANDARHAFETLTPEVWDRALAINLRPHFFTTQACAPAMTEAGGGAVINLTSNSYLLGLTGYPAYIAAKSAIAGLTKSLARELGPSRIRVNAVAPGWVMTEKQRRLWLTPEAERELMFAQSLKDQIVPEDVAALCLFLAADEARMISGQVFVIDGGRV